MYIFTSDLVPKKVTVENVDNIFNHQYNRDGTEWALFPHYDIDDDGIMTINFGNIYIPNHLKRYKGFFEMETTPETNEKTMVFHRHPIGCTHFSSVDLAPKTGVNRLYTYSGIFIPEQRYLKLGIFDLMSGTDVFLNLNID